jgi:hypothetical protein
MPVEIVFDVQGAPPGIGEQAARHFLTKLAFAQFAAARWR